MALFALSAFQAVGQIMSGEAVEKQADFNANLYEQQAGFTEQLKQIEEKRLDIQKNIEIGRAKRAAARISGKLIANVGKSGLDFSGSPVAVMLDNLTQSSIDESIINYNTEIAKATIAYTREQEGIRFKSRASQLRFEGATAKAKGYSDAFSTLLKGAYSYGTRSGAFQTKTKLPSTYKYGSAAYSPGAGAGGTW